MKNITHEVRIDAPLSRVFQVYTDLGKAAERIQGIRRLELLTPGPVQEGTRFRETRVMFGKESTETMEIADLRPERSYSVKAESCGARYLTTFSFEPDEGRTKVRVEFGATPVSFFAKLMAPMMGFMSKSVSKCLEADCADLKAVCEAEEPGN